MRGGGGERKGRPRPSCKQVKFSSLNNINWTWGTCFLRDKPGKGWLWWSFDDPEPETFGDPQLTIGMLFWESIK